MPDTNGIEITVGENSYISVEDADEYLAGELYTEAWDAADDDDKARALISATRAIDRHTLVGRPVDVEQPLGFPRDGFDPEIPVPVTHATAHEAMALLDTDYNFRHALRSYGVTSVSIGNVREGFANRSMRHGGMLEPKSLRSMEARHLMRPYIQRSVPIR